MCGIIGCRSDGINPDMSHFLISALRKLEYRGYDSWGMSISDCKGEMIVAKSVGKVSDAKMGEAIGGKIGFAHTRWATHGEVNEQNAHPHLSCDGKIAVVHNGIIENYSELRNALAAKGHKFTSQTDTEVLAHLIEEHGKALPFKEAVMAALGDIEGKYAICAMSKESDMLIAARKGSPLVIGVGEGEIYVASDIPAFLDKTKRVIYLSDDDFVALDGDIDIYNMAAKKKVERKIDSVDWDMESVMKGEFEHYMLKEISEQYDTLKSAITQDESNIKNIASALSSAKKIAFVASGTSYHACLGGKYFMSKAARKDSNAFHSSEFQHYAPFFGNDSAVIAVSQSGETADVLDAISEARKNGAAVIALTNVMGSSITRAADHSIYLNAGPEICVLATKSYTAQLAAMLLLAYSMNGEKAAAEKIVEDARNALYNCTARSIRDHIAYLAERIHKREHLFIVGRGVNYPSALEAALKIKEVAYIHAEGFAGGELKHGTLAMIEKGTPCIVITGEEEERETISNAQEMKARGAFIIGVGPRQHEVYDFFIKVPECGIANPIVHAIPMQILAYQLAILRGHDPDKPRNLAKSVTVR